jgi:hypothetical protein
VQGDEGLCYDDIATMCVWHEPDVEGRPIIKALKAPRSPCSF